MTRAVASATPAAGQRRKAARRSVSTRKRMLLTAEKLFATEGFDGASVRDITQAVGVDVNMINYYFESKTNLFQEVILTRMGEIDPLRHQLLEQIEIRKNDENCLREILQAFLVPMTGMSEPEGRKLANYRQLIAIVRNTTIWQSRFGSHFDATTQELAVNLKSVLPGLHRNKIHWCANFFLAAMARAVTQPGDVYRLSRGRYRAGSLVETCNDLVEFTVGALSWINGGERQALGRARRRRRKQTA